jgi:hypothetical protein
LPAETSVETPVVQPTIMPPSTGEPVSSTAWPYNKDLPVAEIDPAYQQAAAEEERAAHEAANSTPVTPPESEQAPIHHG